MIHITDPYERLIATEKYVKMHDDQLLTLAESLHLHTKSIELLHKQILHLTNQLVEQAKTTFEKQFKEATR